MQHEHLNIQKINTKKNLYNSKINIAAQMVQIIPESVFAFISKDKVSTCVNPSYMGTRFLVNPITSGYGIGNIRWT